MKNGQFPAVIQLSSLNGQNGFKIDGESMGDDCGLPIHLLQQQEILIVTAGQIVDWSARSCELRGSCLCGVWRPASGWSRNIIVIQLEWYEWF